MAAPGGRNNAKEERYFQSNIMPLSKRGHSPSQQSTVFCTRKVEFKIVACSGFLYSPYRRRRNAARQAVAWHGCCFHNGAPEHGLFERTRYCESHGQRGMSVYDQPLPSAVADRRTPERIRRRGRRWAATRRVLRPGRPEHCGTHRLPDDGRGESDGGRFRKATGTAQWPRDRVTARGHLPPEVSGLQHFDKIVASATFRPRECLIGVASYLPRAVRRA